MPGFTVEFGKPARPSEPDGRLDAGAFHRNHQPIWSVLQPHLADKTGAVLEIGSGTGQHAVEFARGSPGLAWWPSDVSAVHLRSIAAWRAHAQLPNLRAPLRLDLTSSDWERVLAAAGAPEAFLGMLCINVLHIAPWRVAEALFGGAGRLLQPDGRLFVYGPFMRHGRHTADSNAAFDASLRRENPDWGVRDTDALQALAKRHGIRLMEAVPMPANNFVLIAEKRFHGAASR